MKTLHVCLSALVIGILGALLGMTNYGLAYEEEYGLAWLFKLRGSITPPPEVVIISIDQTSAEILQLPDDPEKWSRDYYAQLIEKLNTYQPALISFNIHFGESRDPAKDVRLAKAMQLEDNIILSNYLKQYTIPTNDPANVFSYERIIDPAPILDQAALATSPFPLPKTFSSIKQFWTYKNTAGDIPTFPMTIFQYYVLKSAYPELRNLLTQFNLKLEPTLPKTLKALHKDYKINEFLQIIQSALLQHPNAIEQLSTLLEKQAYPPALKKLINAWLISLTVKDQLYLNHYGNNHSIVTLPFYQALTSNIYDPALFKNKIILVGYSESIEPERNQGLYTVFTDQDGNSISPIEIAATAVANLLEQSWLKPIDTVYQVCLIFIWGCCLAALCKLQSYRKILLGMILAGASYLMVAYALFSFQTLWLPLFIPLGLQLSLFLLTVSLIHFLKSLEAHRNIHKAFSYYLPDAVVNKIVQHSGKAEMNQYGEYVFGVCMATDAGQYTTLSESMNPLELHELINRYYATMFPYVKSFQGMISDVIGDAMLALWVAVQQQPKARQNALEAALQIRSAVQEFNRTQQHPLPTRFGLHYGEMRIGNVGAGDHFEYRAIGDIINTTTRIENLNKQLNTQILVTESVIEGLEDYFLRDLGRFVLKGKTLPVNLYELIDRKDRIEEHWLPLINEFSQALKLFQSSQWEEALQTFLKIHHAYPEDGPTLFYVKYLKKQLPFPSLSQKTEHNASDAAHLEIKQPSKQNIFIEIVDN